MDSSTTSRRYWWAPWPPSGAEPMLRVCVCVCRCACPVTCRSRRRSTRSSCSVWRPSTRRASGASIRLMYVHRRVWLGLAVRVWCVSMVITHCTWTPLRRCVAAAPGRATHCRWCRCEAGSGSPINAPPVWQCAHNPRCRQPPLPQRPTPAWRNCRQVSNCSMLLMISLRAAARGAPLLTDDLPALGVGGWVCGSISLRWFGRLQAEQRASVEKVLAEHVRSSTMRELELKGQLAAASQQVRCFIFHIPATSPRSWRSTLPAPQPPPPWRVD